MCNYFSLDQPHTSYMSVDPFGQVHSMKLTFAMAALPIPKWLLSSVLWKVYGVHEGRLSKATRVPFLLQHHQYWEAMHSFSFRNLSLLVILPGRIQDCLTCHIFLVDTLTMPYRQKFSFSLPPRFCPYCVMWNTTRQGVFSSFLSMLD